tara:strand:- start:705 stop:1778 length:1074 start_codon:yes stop_codon:yes gene_type:complete
MDQNTIQKVEKSIEILKNSQSRVFFLVQDTKGNAKGATRHIYQMAKALKDNGLNPVILHESNDYTGVESWLGEGYMEMEHVSIEGQNLQISPEDFVVIPELYGHVMEQLKDLPCGKIVLAQAYDHIFETLQPGTTWSQYGFLKCITTNEKQLEQIKSYIKNVSFDVIEPLIPSKFDKKPKPSKPIVSIHTREQRDTMKIIKGFYLKYPQYRWITFRDMRGLTQEEFAEYLKDSFVSVWVDDTSGFGTFPIESMASRTPVIGKVPNLKPDWMNEKNGIWTYELNNMVDIIAEFVQNWLEDNISDQLYDECLLTAETYKDESLFNNKVTGLFTEYMNTRLGFFETQLDKLKVEESEDGK